MRRKKKQEQQQGLHRCTVCLIKIHHGTVQLPAVPEVLLLPLSELWCEPPVP